MPKDFFTETEINRIHQAIEEAEKSTSGEIRVHIDLKCKEDVMDRAAFIFEKLEMHKTALRNSVLFYLATEDHKFAILGDVGINQKVPENFWDKIKESMLAHFKNGEFTKGISIGVKMAGEELSAHFPFKKDDKDELDNTISFGKKMK